MFMTLTTIMPSITQEVWYRIYQETLTNGTIREVYGLQGGGTGDVQGYEYKIIPCLTLY